MYNLTVMYNRVKYSIQNSRNNFISLYSKVDHDFKILRVHLNVYLINYAHMFTS